MWEYQEEPTMKDDLLLSMPLLFFPDIFGDFSLVNSLCENSFLDASTSDHSKNTPDVNLSYHSGEDKSLFENPLNSSSVISRNPDCEHSCISSTPLCDSLGHEDADEVIEFYDHGYHDLFTPSFDHNIDSFTLDISKPLIFDDLYVDEMETP